MTTSTVIGSKARRSLRGALRRPRLHRVAVLGVQHELRALRDPTVARPAQLTHHRAVLEEVHVLADERRSAAVVARRPSGREGADALAQEFAVEVGLADAKQRSEHARNVRRRPPASCRHPLIAGPLTAVFRFDIWGTRNYANSTDGGAKGR